MRLFTFEPSRRSIAGRAALASVLLLGGLAARAGAQQPAPAAPARAADSTSRAAVTGFVYDSLRSTPLADATVYVEGLERLGQTNAEGAYRIDSIPPGSYRLSIYHPRLDTLGVSIVTQPVPLPAGVETTISFSIPSARTLVERSCPAGRMALGPSALIGRVLEADADTPVEGARVSLVWEEISIADKLRRVPRVREAVSGADGVYRICGIPAQLEGTLQAEHKGNKTAVLKIAIENEALALQTLRIGSGEAIVAVRDSAAPATPAPARAGQRQVAAQELRRGPAKLTGRVVNASGAPIAGARVDVTGTAAVTLTREDGSFALSDLPTGTQAVVARQLGFAPVETAVDLSSRETRNVTIQMSRPATVLATVDVKAERDEGLDKIGFTRRKKSGFGTYLTPEQLEARQAIKLTDLFRGITMLRVVPAGGTDYDVQSTRGGCVTFFLDGVPWKSAFPGDIDRMIPPGELAAMEVYSGTTAPAEFQQAGGSSCTAVVMWTQSRVRSIKK